jgi:hypothetical protein
LDLLVTGFSQLSRALSRDSLATYPHVDHHMCNAHRAVGNFEHQGVPVEGKIPGAGEEYWFANVEN